jgi:hypothetical protein
MCDIPLDLERRFERRWAARFSGPAKEHRLEGQQQHQRVTTPDKSKRKTRRRGTGGLETFIGGVSAGDPRRRAIGAQRASKT